VPVVDASVWVATLHRADPGHARCSDWLRRALDAGASLTAPSLVLAEVAAAIRRISGHAETGADAIVKLLAVPALDLCDLDVARARRAAEIAVNTGVRGADAVYLALAVERGDVLISLDRQQRERGGAVADVRLP